MRILYKKIDFNTFGIYESIYGLDPYTMRVPDLSDINKKDYNLGYMIKICIAIEKAFFIEPLFLPRYQRQATAQEKYNMNLIFGYEHNCVRA